jgi:glycosyltransferase involved in cell wall biosynthesis
MRQRSIPTRIFFYSDECKIDDTSERRLFDFILKPDWSPEIMFNSMVTGHLTMYRTSLVREIGGFRDQYNFAQDYDLALRMAELSRKVVHVERILYLWRAISGSAASGGKSFARMTNIAALDDALKRRNILGISKAEPHANRVYVTIPDSGSRVSIIIPSDSTKNLRHVLGEIRSVTDFNNYELRVVCNSDVAAELETEYSDWTAVKFVRYDKAYNFSDKCNAGAFAAEGDILVFYNDDVFPLERDWIERLIEYLWVPGVGGTSPQLLYADGTIQYAGMISGTPGMAGTAYHGLPRGNVDPFLSMNRFVRNVSILSGACCAVRRDVFREIGGFDAVNTPDGHSDLDLSFKIQSYGLRCVYTPYSVLTHIGNHSWNTRNQKYKADVFCLKRWGRYVSRDRFFTGTMLRTLYRDFNFDYRIYAEHVDPETIYDGPDVLFLSHELTNTGAPYMLLEAAKAVKASGGFPVVVAPSDGPMRSLFEREGIVVIIDASLGAGHVLFEQFARNFDLAVVNTYVLRASVERLTALPNLPTIWWLHEAESLAEKLADFPLETWKRATTVCVSSYARSFVPEEVPCHVLLNGVPDHASYITAPVRSFEESLTFLLLGTIEGRKGQDIFVQAVARLSEEIPADCRFIIAGKLWPENAGYWDQIEPLISLYREISYMGDVSHIEALTAIAGCDVLVSCSRDDAFSLVAVEAAQFGKPCILSDHVGVREVLDGDCSFLFPSGDVEELKEQIILAYKDRIRLRQMGLTARQMYESRLTDRHFARNFMALVNAHILHE